MIVELADDDKLNKTEVVPETTFKLPFWDADAEELWKNTCVDDGTSGAEENGVADDETTFTKELNFVRELDEDSTGDVATDKRLALIANEELNFVSELDEASTGDVVTDKWLVLMVDEELNFISELDEDSTGGVATDKWLVLMVDEELNFISELDEDSTGDVNTDKRLVFIANEELNFVSGLDKTSTGDVDADKWLVLTVDEELNFVSEVDESSTGDVDTNKRLVLIVGKTDCCEDRDVEEILCDCNAVDVTNSGVLAIVWVNEWSTSEDVNTVDVKLNEEESSCLTELEFTTSVVDSSILVWNGVIEENGIEEDVMFRVQFRPVKLGGHVHV